jgi:hypothetical protein
MVWVRSAYQLEELFALPIVDRYRGYDHLGEDIERILHDMGWLHVSNPHCRDYRCYLYRVVTEGRHQYSATGNSESVTSASNSLQCSGNAFGGLKLYDEIHRSDVDPQLE